MTNRQPKNSKKRLGNRRLIKIIDKRDIEFHACRLYDREGNGYITTATLKEILGALDDKLTSSDLDSIITEIDTDGSGTVDFDGKSDI